MDVVGLGVLLVLALLFAFLAWRAWRARRRWVKLAAGIPTTLLALVCVAALGLAIYGYSKVNATYTNPVANVTLAGTPAQIAHGEKFARACAGCHSTNNSLPLNGANFDGPPIGTFWAANLTPAHLQQWSDGEIIRAIREGVGKDGRSLIIMPSHLFHSMSDDDVHALVAYLRAQPAVEPDSPPRQISLVGALMTGALLPDDIFAHQPPITGLVTAPPAGATPEYGQYLSTVAGCIECHGTQLTGGQSPAGPFAGPSLVAFARIHSDAAFITTIRTGVTPEGHKLSEEMPWQDYEKFSDDDLRALYAYITVLTK